LILGCALGKQSLLGKVMEVKAGIAKMFNKGSVFCYNWFLCSYCVSFQALKFERFTFKTQFEHILNRKSREPSNINPTTMQEHVSFSKIA